MNIAVTGQLHQTKNDSRECVASGVDTWKRLGVMLQTFVNSADRNVDRKKPGYRFDSLTKMFSAYIFMIAGRLAYETLNANLPLSMPSTSTVSRFLTDNGPKIIEGKMRTDELLEYLKTRKLPLKVSLSEDATRITAKISYDPSTNQLIGFALPLDNNGMPIKFSFPARNTKEIQDHFNNSANFISTTAYVQMAQPLDRNTPPFCLMIFLIDNTFTACNVLKRWRFQAAELKEKGIQINNISTDGDARPLKVMKYLSKIGQTDLSFFDCEWYSCGGYVETTFIQDIIHILTKLRNRLLTYSRVFPIGNKIISQSHLKYLLENVSKDKHLMTFSDIEPKDRQNSLSAEKICSKNSIQCLLDYVPGSEGTATYLRATRNLFDAFMDDLNSKERIYLMWYSVFFFRAWRSWLISSEKVKDPTAKNKTRNFYNLKENFISTNCYTCIELNAHALVKQILVEESTEEGMCDRSKLFFPNLYGSQPCEAMFRQIRSFTSTFSTIVNFNMLEIVNRIKKIQLQNDIIATSNGVIKFPRFEKNMSKAGDPSNQSRFEGLTRASIISEIERAKKDVTCELNKFGIDTTQLNFNCQVKPVHEEDMMKDDDCESDDELDEFDLRLEYDDIYSDDDDDGEEYELDEPNHLEDLNSLSGKIFIFIAKFIIYVFVYTCKV